MVQTMQKAKRVGGSLMVRIPKDIVEFEDIKEGETLDIEIKKIRKDWFGAFPELTSFKKEDKIHFKHE